MGIYAAVCIVLDSVAFGLGDGHIGIGTVVLDGGYDGEVLDYVFRDVVGVPLSCVFLAVESETIVHSDRGCNIAEFGAIYEDLAFDCALFAGFQVLDCDFPSLGEFLCGYIGGFFAEFDVILCSYEFFEYLFPYMGLEHDQADPGGLEFVPSSVPVGKFLLEFFKDSCPEIVVAVNGGHSCGCEHAAKPGEFFDKEY